MKSDIKTIYLKDYKEPEFFVENAYLEFDLYENETIVTSKLQMVKNPQGVDNDLTLFGKDLKLLSMSINEIDYKEFNYNVDDEVMIIRDIPEKFELKTVTQIDPANNTSLEGLYYSSKMFCTQCEAEGFRRITWYPDRPDVMSNFKTKIIADKKNYPALLSNGNRIDFGNLDNNRHFAVWEDPFKKPSYLFALVAGDLVALKDKFTTTSGKKVDLEIYVEKENINKCDHAMKSLKQAMKWDEDVFGREYDLDIYMIVAVDAFNMGAMENKGLNIFNSSLVLAKPETATDLSFQRIEAVIAHEYFHNWSGNRVTCRDWFQLSLKEGFTVLRDQLFSADMGSKVVKRIEDVIDLRTTQFAEDSSPMAHSVQPDSYMEISNFYTSTVYEKGAEVVRMIKTILGDELFRRGSDLYFEKFDGKAVTIEDFVKTMEDISNFDLTQFRNWYTQSGTPKLKIYEKYNGDKSQYTLTIEQYCDDTPNQKSKKPFFIPLKIGLINSKGDDMSLNVKEGMVDLEKNILYVKETKETFIFENIDERPVLSVLRDFSAPIKVEFDYSKDDYLFLMKNDKNSFSRWNAFNEYILDVILNLIDNFRNNIPLKLDNGVVSAFRSVITNNNLDKAIVAKIIQIPSEAYISEQMEVIYVDAIYEARKFLINSLGNLLFDEFIDLYNENNLAVKYSVDYSEMSRRLLKNTALSFLVYSENGTIALILKKQIEESDNMTDVSAALSLIANSNFEKESESELANFYEKWKDESLVVNQWLAIQARVKKENSIEKIKKLLNHKSFDIKNPNKVRSLIGVFANDNSVNFHKIDGSGYKFLEEQVLILDKLNPQISARMVKPFVKWKKYDEERSLLMKKSLHKIQKTTNISKDLYEIVTKSLV